MAAAYSSEWWLEELGGRLDAREGDIRRLRQYYAGKQPLALASQKFRDQFGSTYGKFADNFLALVVQAVEERLAVQGFRWSDDEGSRAAWEIWQANKMDAQSLKAHRDAFITAQSPVMVWLPKDGTTTPIIRVQKPEECIVAYDDDPLVRAVAMKRWKTLDGRWLAGLYYPDRIEKYEQLSRNLPGSNQYQTRVANAWVERRVDNERWPLPHAMGAVPVVELVNDPDLDNVGTSEIASAIPLQDALNKLMVDLLVASEFGSFRQKWVTGMEIPVDPETNKPIEVFKEAVNRVWQARDPNVKFGDFDQADLAPIAKGVETVIQHIATTTRTPAHYLLGQSGTFPSGESLKATETGLVAKARRDQGDFGEQWEEILRLAFRAAGDTERGAIVDGEVKWRDPEYRSEAEHVDAMLKQQALGVPREYIWEQLGYSPQQIERFKAMGADPGPELDPTESQAAASAMPAVMEAAA